MILRACLYTNQVRFFYSFTCSANLYLVMEYLNGGDLFSMLRNLGCLEEDMARVYIAELVSSFLLIHSLDCNADSLWTVMLIHSLDCSYHILSPCYIARIS